MTDKELNTSDSSHLLPDFCNNQTILLVILVAELLAILLALHNSISINELFSQLAQVSFFILSIALLSAAILCHGRQWLCRLTPTAMGLSVYGIIQIITIIITFISLYLSDTNEFFLAKEISNSSFLILRNICVSSILTACAMRYFYVQHQNHLREKTEAQAKIQALQARIRPHFLFNSLNTIANLIHVEPDKAEDALIDLAELFRSNLANRNNITLAEELDVCRRYTEMELLRLGNRLTIEWDIADDILQTSIPALVLQPLVENAIYHGIEPLTDGGKITIIAERQKNKIMIKVINPITDQYKPKRAGSNQVAINNIRERLKLSYDSNASFTTHQNNDIYTVTLILPINAEIK